MNRPPVTPFDSIESAHTFVVLLSKAVAESMRDVEADVKREAGSTVPRRLDALQITLYNLKKLEAHLSRSRRILNDLRSLRRLLFDERGSTTVKAALKSAAGAAGKSAPVPMTIAPSNGKADRTSAA